MALAPGTLLGAYEIGGLLGAGGMGEVYRARDRRLQRDVAIKIVPAAVSDDPVALARFEREAQAIASLSHPNILAIHDIGRDAGVSYAVMQLLDGQTLADVLERGPLPVRKALDYAGQVANGLAAAHERGIVHRDIKPANLFINADGRVTILDFGLARVTEPVTSDFDVTMAPSTTPGMVVGTMGYMSPEQVRGLPVDHRTDIFALGAVLYEMVSGRRAFTGATPADSMSAILNSDPPPLVLDGQLVSPALDRIIRRCLEKSSAQRFQSTRDLGFALDAIGSTPSSGIAPAPPPAPRRIGLLPVAVLSLVAGVALTLGASRVFAPTADRVASVAAAVVRFTMPSRPGTGVALSPDGTAVAWNAVAPRGGVDELWVRRFASPAPFAVEGTAGLAHLQWRDDSRRLFVVRENTLLSVEPESGVSTPVRDVDPSVSRTDVGGMLISEDGDILLGLGDDIANIRREGSGSLVVARPDSTTYVSYAFPQRVAGDARVLFVGTRAQTGVNDTLVVPNPGGAPVRVDMPTSTSRVLVDPGGALVYGRNSALVAQRFDLATLQPQGEPVVLAEDVLSDRSGMLAAAISPSNVLAYRSGALSQQRFDWIDREGKVLATTGSPASYSNFDLSPDGTRLAVLRRLPTGSNALWIFDLARGTETMVADPAAGVVADPTWSPDGTRLAYRRGTTTVVRNAFGGTETTVANFEGFPDSWSRDGRYLAVGRPRSPFFELWVIRVDGTKDEMPIVQGQVNADEARFSPDGKWIAYHATVGGSSQVYVMPFPATGERFQLSADGGVQPRWRADGRELYYLDFAGRLCVVEMAGGDPRAASPARVLFAAGVATSNANDQFTPAPDGKRFLVRRTTGGEDQSPVHVILNWRQLLGDRR